MAQMQGPNLNQTETELREEIRRFYHERNYYINKDTFFTCMPKISSWINLPVLTPYLMRHGILTNAGEMGEISSPYLSNQMKLNNLFTYTESNGGRDGYFILYKCFCESREEVPLGHGDVVDELERYAAAHHTTPEWLEQGGETSDLDFRPQSNVNMDQPGGQSLSTARSMTGGQATSSSQAAQQAQVPPHRQLSFSGPTLSKPTQETAVNNQDGTNSLSPGRTSRVTSGVNATPPVLASGSGCFQGDDAERDRPGGQGRGAVTAAHQSHIGLRTEQFKQNRELPSMESESASLRSYSGHNSAAFPEAISVVSGQAMADIVSDLENLPTPSQSQVPSSQSATTPPTALQSQATPPTALQSQATPPTALQSQATPPTALQSQVPSSQSATTPPTALQSQATPPTAMQSQATLPTALQSQATPPTAMQSQATPPTASQSKSTSAPTSHLQHTPPTPSPSQDTQHLASQLQDTLPTTPQSQLIASVRQLLMSGDVHALCTKYDDSIDIQLVPPECCTDKAKVFPFVCSFVCAVLNSRDSRQHGVLLGGIGFNEEKQVYETHGVQLDSEECQRIESRLHQVLCLSIKYGHLGLAEKNVDEVDISRMVQVEFLKVMTTDGGKSVVLLNVVPKEEVCKGAVYYHIEASQCQCYLRHNGQTVSVKPHKICELKNKLSSLWHS